MCFKCENFSIPSREMTSCECGPGYFGFPNYPDEPDSTGTFSVLRPQVLATLRLFEHPRVVHVERILP